VWELGSRKPPDGIFEAGRVMDGGGGIPEAVCCLCTGDSGLPLPMHGCIWQILVGRIGQGPVVLQESSPYLEGWV